MENQRPVLSSSITFFITIIGLAVVFIILKELQSIFIPLIIAYFLFFVFSPLNGYLERKKIPKGITILVDILIIVFIFGGISSIIIDSFSRFGAELPGYARKLDAIVSSTALSIGLKDPSFRNFHIEEFIKTIDYKLVAGSIFSSTFSLLGSLLFILFFFIFVVTGHKNIYEAIQRRYTERRMHHSAITLPPGTKERADTSETSREEVIQTTFHSLTEQVQKYVTTKFLISLFTGALEGSIVWLFGVDFAIVWGVLIFLLNFIPNIGSLAGIVLPAIMALVQFGSIGYALIVLGTLTVVDNIIGNYVEPKIFGDRLGLNPLVVLLSLLLWSYVWGIIGAILSVPLTSMVKILISRSESPNLRFLNDLMSSERHNLLKEKSATVHG